MLHIRLDHLEIKGLSSLAYSKNLMQSFVCKTSLKIPKG